MRSKLTIGRVRCLRGALRARWVAASALLLASLCNAQQANYADIPAGTFTSVLKVGDAQTSAPVPVAAFSMRVTPVTQRELLNFVITHPEWRRDRVAQIFAASGYLKGWASPVSLPGAQSEQQPATDVSWFAAQAFCESEGARLPTWLEWEYVAAADATHRDARNDPAWVEQILSWYARPASQTLRPVGGEANAYGVRDMQGLIWEWVDDFNALLVTQDSRSSPNASALQFCGGGAINVQDPQNYAMLMRVALLSSLTGSDSTSSLGFRCVRPAKKEFP